MSSPSVALSASKPRVRVAPRAVESDADDAAFLSSNYGLTPDPWQEDVLEDWLGRRRDGRWSAATCGLSVARQNGKNGVIEIRELFGMVGLGEKFLHTAHEVKTARKAFKRIASFFENERAYPELAKLVVEIRKTNGQEAVVLSNGGSVEFVARSRGSGRGFTVDVLVLDEAQDLTDDELEALGPTISAAPLGNPQTILTGTPPNPEKNQTGEVFSRVRLEGVNRTDPRLSWIDYGVADGPIPDVEDRGLWQRTNPALGGRLHIEVVENERKLYSRSGFARERLGWWGDPDEARARAKIDPKIWAGLTDERAELDSAPAISVEVSRDREWSTIGVAGAAGDKTLVFVQSRKGMGWVAAEVVRLAEKHSPVEIALDPSGPAGSLLADIESTGHEVKTFTARDMAQACGNFQNIVTEQTLVHLGQAQLDTAIRSAITKDVGDAEKWDRREGGADISPLVAASIACLSYSRNADNDEPFNIW